MSYLGDTALEPIKRSLDEAWAAAASRITVAVGALALLGYAHHLFMRRRR